MGSEYINKIIAARDREINNLQYELSEQQVAIDKLKTAFKFAYENGTFYPAAFNVLDPVYDEFIKDD